MAVVQRGAIGVVSTRARVLHPAGPAGFPGRPRATERVGRAPVGRRAVRRDEARLRVQGHAASRRKDQSASRRRIRPGQGGGGVQLLAGARAFARGRNPGRREAAGTRASRGARPGAWSERQRERVRDAGGTRPRDQAGHPRREARASWPHADVHLGRRDAREPAVDRRSSGRGEAGPLHVLARHDGREYAADRGHVPHREGARPDRRLAPAVRPAHRVGQQPREGRGAEGHAPQRPVPRRVRSGCRGSCAPTRTRAAATTRSSWPRACRRCWPGTFRIGSIIPASTGRP